MFSEWRKRSKIWYELMSGPDHSGILLKFEAYDLASAAYKAGVRAGIKQEQDRLNKSRVWAWGEK